MQETSVVVNTIIHVLESQTIVVGHEFLFLSILNLNFMFIFVLLLYLRNNVAGQCFDHFMHYRGRRVLIHFICNFLFCWFLKVHFVDLNLWIWLTLWWVSVYRQSMFVFCNFVLLLNKHEVRTFVYRLFGII